MGSLIAKSPLTIPAGARRSSRYSSNGRWRRRRGNAGGQDRTSFAAALYIIHRDGWGALEIARAQFARFPYLHFPKRHQRWLKRFLDYAVLASAGRPIAQWVREFYEPEQLAEWLDANGNRGTYKEVFTRAEASRWQW